MSQQARPDEQKVAEYLDVIDKRILTPIRDTNIRDYCAATLLLLFAAIDGLGRLIHPKDNAGSNARIRRFLGFMGRDYGICKEELLGLRNSLVHNAINVESFLWQTDMSGDQHLKKIGAAGFIFVNTRLMHADVEDAFKRFREEITRDRALLKRAADRLEWREESADEIDDSPAQPTPPPPVQFIHTKRGVKRRLPRTFRS